MLKFLGVGLGLVSIIFLTAILLAVNATIAGSIFAGLLLLIDYICGTSLFSWQFIGMFVGVFIAVKLLASRVERNG